VGKENTADNTTERRVVSISRISLALSAIDSLLLSKDNSTFFPQRGSLHPLSIFYTFPIPPFALSIFLDWITGILASIERTYWIRNTLEMRIDFIKTRTIFLICHNQLESKYPIQF
jgi:hypothetical protein